MEKDTQSDELDAEQRGLFLAQLKGAGWYAGSRRGSLATSRAGITWEIAPLRGSEGRWELRFSYHTDTTHAEGDVTLPPDADQAALADAMTGVYLRIHDKPDPSRVLGRVTTRRPTRPASGTATPNVEHTPPPIDPSQGSLDF